MKLLPYFLLGSAFGFVMVEAEVVSWFRIQEMFLFDAFHMYGIIGSAVLTAFVSLLVIERLKLRDASGEPIRPESKKLGSGVRYFVGGSIFGLGWSMTGACPGPLVALVAADVPVMLVAILSALLGTWTYGVLRPKLPR